MLKRIIKRDGSVEDFTAIKLIKWVQYSARFIKKQVEWEVIISQVVRESQGARVTWSGQSFS